MSDAYMTTIGTHERIKVPRERQEAWRLAWASLDAEIERMLAKAAKRKAAHKARLAKLKDLAQS